MNKVIILAGKAQSGKDSAARAISDYLYAHSRLRTKIYSFADPLKQFCINVFGLSYSQCYGTNADKSSETNISWGSMPIAPAVLSQLMFEYSVQERMIHRDTLMTARELLEVWGTNVCRHTDFDCWARATKNMVLKDQRSHDNDFAIIADTRFPNEIDFFEDQKPLVIRLLRNPLDLSSKIEIALDDYDWSKSQNLYIIDNSHIPLNKKNRMVIDIVAKHYNLYNNLCSR